MITALIKIAVPFARQKSAVEAVQSILGWTSAQPGCISIALYQDTNNPDLLMLLQEWEDWGSVETHIRSDAFRNVFELMELSSEQPEIKFNSVSESKGMELIEKLRA